MIFIVNRASTVWNGDEVPPCEEAVMKPVLHTDERDVDDPMKNPYIGKAWYTDEGYFNHRIEDCHIKRDKYFNEWTIEINTFEELMNFIDKYGDIIIADRYNQEFKEITIYDDYVE